MYKKIELVSLHAKQRYCERKRPGWLYIIDKILTHQPLDEDDKKKYKLIEEEILSAVNEKGRIINGLNKNNPNSGRIGYKDLIYVVKFEKGVGKVITIHFDILNYRGSHAK